MWFYLRHGSVVVLFQTEVSWFCFRHEVSWFCFRCEVSWFCFRREVSWFCFRHEVTVVLFHTQRSDMVLFTEVVLFQTFWNGGGKHLLTVRGQNASSTAACVSRQLWSCFTREHQRGTTDLLTSRTCAPDNPCLIWIHPFLVWFKIWKVNSVKIKPTLEISEDHARLQTGTAKGNKKPS